MMQGYNFTERVRKVLAMAREESSARHHQYVGTEHLLLAMIREGQGVGAAVLQLLDVDLEALKERIDRSITGGDPAHATGPDLPFTSRAKKVLELSMSSARDLDHSYVGTEHLLLGLIREQHGLAAEALCASAVTFENASQKLLKLLGTTRPGPARQTPGTITLVTIEQRMADGTIIRNEFRSAAAARAFLEDH
jgi:ATP-dependent Clp protease ATP-binding subunit ClpC